jgi:methionyl aminopeptidase
MHEGPQVPNYGVPGRGLPLRPGMTIALEPMVLAGTSATRVLSDQWTVVSADGSLTAHSEHSVAITEGEPLVLTVL